MNYISVFIWIFIINVIVTFTITTHPLRRDQCGTYHFNFCRLLLSYNCPENNDTVQFCLVKAPSIYI